MTFDGFISYSHAADGRLAPAVQRGLHRLAKPWHRRRALWIFRDQTGLSVTPALWSSIQDALDGSRYFVLLASPEAARSPWVNREIDHWVATKPVDRILPVVTGGNWQWDVARGDFTPDSTAVPDALRDVFAEEPLFLDLRWARSEQHLALHHPRFREAIAQLAAPMHGISKDELEGEDVRQHRRTRRLRSAAVASLALLTVSALLASALAVRNADRATASELEARHQERAAAQQRGTAEQAAAEAQRQRANADEQQAKAQSAAAETQRQTMRSRSLKATADRAATDARRQQEQAQLAKRDAHRQQQLASRHQALAEQQASLAKEQRRLAKRSTQESSRQRIIAKKQKRLAEEAAEAAKRQQAIAKQQQLWAEQAKAEALRQEANAKLQENRAQEAAENAARQEQIAAGRRLINDAKATIQTEPALSLKLGLAAQSLQPGDEAGRELAGLVTSTRHAGVISNVLWAAYGASGILATSDLDFKLSLWNVADRAHPVRLTTLDVDGVIGEPAFSRDRRTLAVRTTEPDEVALFDVSNPTLPVRLGTVPCPEVHEIHFSPDGHTLATVNFMKSWQLWDITDRTRPVHLTEQPIGLGDLAFSPDSRTVVTQDEPATIWDVTDRSNPTRIGKLDGDWQGDLAFSPTQPVLATNNSNYSLVLWDLRDPERPREIAGIRGNVRTVEFSSDGSTIATNDTLETTTLWDVADFSDPVRIAELSDDNGSAHSQSLSPDGLTLATAGSTGTLTLRNVRSYGEPISRQPAIGEDRKETLLATLSPDGRRLTTAHSDGTATIWDLSNPTGPQPRTNLRIKDDYLHTPAMNPAGNLVASLSGHDVTLTDITDPARPVPLDNLPDAPVFDGPYGAKLAFSPDGQTLAVAEAGVLLWDLTDPRKPVKLAYLNDDTGPFYEILSAIAFSPDGRTLAVANERTIRIWNLANRSHPVHTGTLKGHIDAVLTLAFSPDGRLLAAGGKDNKISLWTVTEGVTPRRLATMTGQRTRIYAVAFAPDGRTLASAASDGTTLLWDVGRPTNPVRLAMLHRTGRTAPWLLFSADGHTLLSSTGDGLTRTRALVWDFSALNDLRSHPIPFACAVAGGGFTAEEWADSVAEVPYRQTCRP